MLHYHLIQSFKYIDALRHKKAKTEDLDHYKVIININNSNTGFTFDLKTLKWCFVSDKDYNTMLEIRGHQIRNDLDTRLYPNALFIDLDQIGSVYITNFHSTVTEPDSNMVT